MNGRNRGAGGRVGFQAHVDRPGSHPPIGAFMVSHIILILALGLAANRFGAALSAVFPDVASSIPQPGLSRSPVRSSPEQSGLGCCLMASPLTWVPRNERPVPLAGRAGVPVLLYPDGVAR